MRRHPLLLCLSLCCVGCSSVPTQPDAAVVPAGDYLYLWTADADGAEDDFLAVVDVRDDSPTYATIVATVPVGKRSTVPHHTEHALAADGLLFANGFASGDTFVFDMQVPASPRLLSSFGAPAPYRQPHSYARLPDGNVVATLQASGADGTGPGGLLVFRPDGTLVRTVSADDPTVDDHFLPYSLAVIPALDRVVTTSADMHERWVSKVVQVWSLPGLERLHTLQLPPGPRGQEGWDPAEPRVLADGRTVMVSTFNCGLYLITGLEGGAPEARFVHAFAGGGCALPVVIGDYWIQTVPSEHALVVLDVSRPAQPREVSRVRLAETYAPHWISAEPGGRRLVMTSYGPRVLLFDFDPDTGRIGLNQRFRDADATEPGLRMERGDWPHGDSGKAMPHGAVFSH